MTIDYCYGIQIIKQLNPSTTVDTVPVDFKLDRFMFVERDNEYFQVFMPTFTKHLKRLFYY